MTSPKRQRAGRGGITDKMRLDWLSLNGRTLKKNDRPWTAQFKLPLYGPLTLRTAIDAAIRASRGGRNGK